MLTVAELKSSGWNGGGAVRSFNPTSALHKNVLPVADKAGMSNLYFARHPWTDGDCPYMRDDA